MEDPECWEQSGAHDRTGHGGSQDRIAVIEQVVGRRTFAGTVKFGTEQF